jgi:TatD DNase family protein
MAGSTSGRRVLDALPRERVLTETDAPFTRVGGTPSSPLDVRSVVRSLARAWGVPDDEAKSQVYANMTAVFARTSKVA